ncbi:unnamed protein product [Staurois parvus]|uniref:Peptide chain release factor domain-containing protein n=1 Tax=Staurois parvus TaxID=386267 RepID=A0ABN9DBX7_9NEOB|nr:unnamed protein product [Staurois parvus]
MLLSVGRCVLCGVRTGPGRRLWGRRYNVLPGLGSAVQWKRRVGDSRRPPCLEGLVRSDEWSGYLQRWEAQAAQTAGTAADQQRAASWEGGEKVGWSNRQILPVIKELRAKERELSDLHQLMADESEDLKALANTEIASCVEEIMNLKYQIACLLIPRDEEDDCNLILELTAGVGGQEAMLFTAEMFDMYQRYAAHKKIGFLTYWNTPTVIWVECDMHQQV